MGLLAANKSLYDSYRRIGAAIMLLLTLLLLGSFVSDPASPRPLSKEPKASLPKLLPKFQGGVCWDGGPDEAGLAYLAENGVGWISLHSLGYGHKEKHSPPPKGYRYPSHKGETLEDVRLIIQIAHRLGLKVLLKPHIWFANGKSWRGEIEMKSEEDWQTWFAMYLDFIQPFVEIAQTEKVAVFCVATELNGTIGREKQWRALIAHVRANYSGTLTYGANWHQEFEGIAFWDALDAIGVQAYFPLSKKLMPSIEELKAAWKPWKEKMRALSERTKRPILLTEFGYKPVVGTTTEPWKWSDPREQSPQAQLDAYEGALQALSTEAWFRGIYFWKWFPGYTGGERQRRFRKSFSPQGFPAEQAMFRWLKKLSPLVVPAPKQEDKTEVEPAPKKSPPPEKI